MKPKFLNTLHAAYLGWLNAADNRELLDRSKDGSASSAWACEVARHVADRQARIAVLTSGDMPKLFSSGAIAGPACRTRRADRIAAVACTLAAAALALIVYTWG